MLNTTLPSPTHSIFSIALPFWAELSLSGYFFFPFTEIPKKKKMKSKQAQTPEKLKIVSKLNEY